MINPLFLKFSLWFLSTDTFYFQLSKDCYGKITSYLASHFDRKQEIEYPPLRMPPLTTTTDSFFRDTLVKCKSVKTLSIESSRQFYLITSKVVNRVLKLLNKSFLNNLAKIMVGYIKPEDTDDSALTIVIGTSHYEPELLRILLYGYNLSHRNPQVYLNFNDFLSDQADVTKLLTKDIKELYKYIKYLRVKYSGRKVILKASGKLPRCPTFRSLRLEEHHIDRSVPSAFKEALQEGKLPNFRRVDLENCCGFASPDDWPEEVVLNITSLKVWVHQKCSVCFPEKERGENSCGTVT